MLQVLDIGSFFVTPVNSASLTVQVTGYRSGALKPGANVTLALSTATPHQQVFLPQPSFTGVDTVSPLTMCWRSLAGWRLVVSVPQLHTYASAGRRGRYNVHGCKVRQHTKAKRDRFRVICAGLLHANRHWSSRRVRPGQRVCAAVPADRARQMTMLLSSAPAQQNRGITMQCRIEVPDYAGA